MIHVIHFCCLIIFVIPLLFINMIDTLTYWMSMLLTITWFVSVIMLLITLYYIYSWGHTSNFKLKCCSLCVHLLIFTETGNDGLSHWFKPKISCLIPGFWNIWNIYAKAYDKIVKCLQHYLISPFKYKFLIIWYE